MRRRLIGRQTQRHTEPMREASLSRRAGDGVASPAERRAAKRFDDLYYA